MCVLVYHGPCYSTPGYFSCLAQHCVPISSLTSKDLVRISFNRAKVGIPPSLLQRPLVARFISFATYEAFASYVVPDSSTQKDSSTQNKSTTIILTQYIFTLLLSLCLKHMTKLKPVS